MALPVPALQRHTSSLKFNKVIERPPVTTRDQTVDIRALGSLLWVRRWLVAGFTLFGFVCAVIYLHTAQYKYEATLVVVSTQGQGGPEQSRLGQLASLAGISGIQQQQASPFTLYPVVLKSRAVAEDIIRRHPSIYSHFFKNWHRPSGGVSFIKSIVKYILGFPVNNYARPGADELRNIISSEISLDVHERNAVIGITTYGTSPEFAKKFLVDVNESTDHVLRTLTLERATKYAAYLEARLKTEQTKDLQQVLIQSLSQQETLLMMSKADTPFAAQPLGTTSVSPFPVTPKAPEILALGIVFGAALGGLASLFNLTLLTQIFRRRAV